MTTGSTSKRLDPLAYNALADALAVIYWNKKPWERYLRGVLRDVPEILAVLDFDGSTKRETAGHLVDLLMRNEDRYQEVTIGLMLNVAEMDSFPNLIGQDDSRRMIDQATAAVAELRKWTRRHQEIIDGHEAYARDLAKASEAAGRSRVFAESLSALRAKFLEMHAATSDAQTRGRVLEGFINELFRLFDLEPRAAYSLEREQIDGAFSFDTDDYILEAKWWNKAMGRGHLDEFATKVRRKGRNALGLYVSISGFTKDALDEYSDSTPFIAMDGVDLMTVLEGQVRLDDLLRRKKRYMNETGHCFFRASAML
jgi:hypothetical protein